MSEKKTETFFDKVERAFDARAREDAEVERSTTGRVNKTPRELYRAGKTKRVNKTPMEIWKEANGDRRNEKAAEQMRDDLARFTNADLLRELSIRNDDSD